MRYSEIHKRKNPTTSPPRGQGYSLLIQEGASGFRYCDQLSILKSQALPLGMYLCPANLLKQDQPHVYLKPYSPMDTALEIKKKKKKKFLIRLFSKHSV